MELPRFNPISGASEVLDGALRGTSGWQDIFSRAQAMQQAKEEFPVRMRELSARAALSQVSLERANNELARQNRDMELDGLRIQNERAKIEAEGRRVKAEMDFEREVENVAAELPSAALTLQKIIEDPNSTSEQIEAASTMFLTRYSGLEKDPKFSAAFVRHAAPVLGNAAANVQLRRGKEQQQLDQALEAVVGTRSIEELRILRASPGVQKMLRIPGAASSKLSAALRERESGFQTAEAAVAKEQRTQTFELKKENIKAGVDLAERQVDGYEGAAPTKEEAIKFREATSVNNQVIDGVRSIVDLAKEPGASIPKSPAYERIKTLQAFLVGKLRLPMTGPGAFTDSERQFVRDAIGNPAKLFALEKSEQAKIEELIKRLEADIDTTARGLGLRRKPRAAAKVTAQDLVKSAQGSKKP